MKVSIAVVRLAGADIGIALVESACIDQGGDDIIARLEPFLPRLPIMLVSVEDNGYRAHAYFNTTQHLALLQLEGIDFQEVDLDFPPPPPDESLPF